MNAIIQNNKIILTQSAVIMSVSHYFVTDTDHLTDVQLQQGNAGHNDELGMRPECYMKQKRNSCAILTWKFSEDVALEYPAKMIHEDIIIQPNYGNDETKNELGLG